MGIGDFFRNLGHKIDDSVKKTNNAVAQSVKKTDNAIVKSVQHSNTLITNSIKKTNSQIVSAVTKPSFLAGLQKATQIMVGIAELTPIGKGLVKAAVLIADKTDHGAASSYLDNGNSQNSTLDMMPGGFLMQTVANDASGGKSGQFLSQYDPKKLAMNDVKTVAKSTLTNPHNTVAVIKQLAKSNVVSVNKSMAAPSHTLAIAMTHNVVKPVPKPSLIAIKNVVHTLVPILPPAIKPNLLASLKKAENVVVQHTNTLGIVSNDKPTSVVPVQSTLSVIPASITPTLSPIAQVIASVSSPVEPSPENTITKSTTTGPDTATAKEKGSLPPEKESLWDWFIQLLQKDVAML